MDARSLKKNYMYSMIFPKNICNEDEGTTLRKIDALTVAKTCPDQSWELYLKVAETQLLKSSPATSLGIYLQEAGARAKQELKPRHSKSGCGYPNRHTP